MANVILESARGYDSFRIEDEMMKNNREVFLVQDVNPASANELIKQLMYLDREDDTAEITLYINSPGGSVQDGLTIYDVITLLHAPVRTVCLGFCASMGAILFLAGEKREMMRHGKIMIHDPSYAHHDIGGRKPHEIQAELDDLNRCREELARIIAERTGQPLEKVYEVTAKDTYFNADEAVAFGIATNIVS
jgi:ATP-dependent Clp protease protease subunit